MNDTERRLAHLRAANRVRTTRAELKRQIGKGEISIVDVIANPPDCAGSAKMTDVLCWAPGMGRIKADRILLQCRISTHRQFCRLTENERGRLLWALQMYCKAAWRRWELGTEAASEA